MKYSDNFIRDVNWYLKVRHQFNFDGKPEKDIVYDKNGIDGVKAFFLFDSQGKLKSTKHPNILGSLLRTKGSVNLHIKMYAEDRANGIFPKWEMEDFLKKIDAPQWMYDAIENQKIKYL